MTNFEEQAYYKIKKLADKYMNDLSEKTMKRMLEMKLDNTQHYLIYNILGVPTNEGYLIDLYQNKGRFLYRYAGSFLEEATLICFKLAYPEARKYKIKNILLNSKQKTFEIDCLINNRAHEIKWRDATTDGDHIKKEQARIQAIKQQGFIPIRIMFFYPNREQAQNIQQKLKKIYLDIGGEYYCGKEAWDYIYY